MSDEEIKDAFNAMSFENRSVSAKAETLARIGDVERAKIRLKENYQRELTYLNEKIKMYRKYLKP